MIIAALDIGSNSFHLLIASVTTSGLVAEHRYKQTVQLGAGLDADNNLTHLAIERGLETLRSFVAILNQHQVSKVYCVATNTLRLANNADEFIQHAESILLSSVDVISGDDEARLIFKGIVHEQPRSGSGMVMDIGGGSTEFALGNAEAMPETCSLQMGCVSYSSRFFSDGKIYPENTQAAIAASRLCLEPELGRLRKTHGGWMIGTSGTVQSIADVCHELYQTDKNFMLREHLEDLLKRLILVGHVDKIKFKSIEINRSGILPAGLCICLSVMLQLNVNTMHVGYSSLAEGLLIEKTDSAFSELNIAN